MVKKKEFEEIEDFMKQCMRTGAHDCEHVYRVLYAAMDIASWETAVDYDVLIAACLLHDIGRAEEEISGVCHAKTGAVKAYQYLVDRHWEEEKAARVKACIAAHRYGGGQQPESVEAKILFDADKLDTTGALGAARTLLYKGELRQPLYLVEKDGRISDGSGDTEESFFQEYKRKLEKLYDGFYTVKGTKLAGERRQAAEVFYRNVKKEAEAVRDSGLALLKRMEETG